jgi:DNA-binding response OmpR family regulator
MTTSRVGSVTGSRAVGVPGPLANDLARRRILLIAGDLTVRSLVGPALCGAGYAVDRTPTGSTGVRHATQSEYDLVVLDLAVSDLAVSDLDGSGLAGSDLDGRALLKRLLSVRPELAVLVLSGLADVTAKVECLELGAQDYLTKPFAIDELIARVRVQLRGATHRHGDVIRTGGLTLDLWRLQADSGHGPVPLTRLEFLLLRELVEHAGESVPKCRLLASIWGYDFDPHSNVVDVCIRRLRTKLGFDLIKTVRGEGYQFPAR